MIDPGQVADVRQAARSKNIASKLRPIVFAHENATFAFDCATSNVFGDGARRAVVIADFIGCV
jgi:hypothetical protein